MASPMACEPDEQAVLGASVGPRARNRIETWQAAALYISRGSTSGDKRLAFFLYKEK